MSDLTLSDFLLARLAEDEEAAHAAATCPERVAARPGDAEWSNIPEHSTPAHWGYGGGPFRVASEDPRVVEALGLTDSDKPFHVSVGGAWDDTEPTGWRYDVATVPSDHDAARHIARHDPARVLREVEAMRRIVEMHPPQPTSDGAPECRECSWYEAYEGFNDHSEPWPCPTLRTLATIWADHEDYRAGWAP
jgi:hypothetical protein